MVSMIVPLAHLRRDRHGAGHCPTPCCTNHLDFNIESPDRQPVGDSAAIARSAALPVIPITMAALPVVPVTRALPLIAVAAVTPVTLVALVAVTPGVIVAAATIPVATPPRIPQFAGAPVINGCRCDGLGLGDCRRSQTREPQSCGQYER
jgi:hypothetical protein